MIKKISGLFLFLLLTTLCFGSISEVVIGDPNSTGRVGVTNGVLDVGLQDQHTEMFILSAHQNLGNLDIDVSASIDDQSVSVVSASGVTVGDILCLKENGRFYQGSITATAATTVTINEPLDYAFTDASEIHYGKIDLAVDGSSSTQTFHIKPPTGVKWDVTRVLLHIEDNSVMDTAKFGGISALTNGLMFRVKNGIYKNILNMKTNGDMAGFAYDTAYDTKAPAGSYAFRSRLTFAGQNKIGVTVRLDGDTSDELQFLVRDDLTALDHVHIIVEGHVVE